MHDLADGNRCNSGGCGGKRNGTTRKSRIDKAVDEQVGNDACQGPDDHQRRRERDRPSLLTRIAQDLAHRSGAIAPFAGALITGRQKIAAHTGRALIVERIERHCSTVAHMQHVRAALQDEFGVVRDDERAEHLVAHGAQKRAEALHAATVKATCGLVVEQDVLACAERRGNGHALLLPARERGGVTVLVLEQAQALKNPIYLLLGD